MRKVTRLTSNGGGEGVGELVDVLLFLLFHVLTSEDDLDSTLTTNTTRALKS